MGQSFVAAQPVLLLLLAAMAMQMTAAGTADKEVEPALLPVSTDAVGQLPGSNYLTSETQRNNQGFPSRQLFQTTAPPPTPPPRPPPRPSPPPRPPPSPPAPPRPPPSPPPRPSPPRPSPPTPPRPSPPPRPPPPRPPPPRPFPPPPPRPSPPTPPRPPPPRPSPPRPPSPSPPPRPSPPAPPRPPPSPPPKPSPPPSPKPPSPRPRPPSPRPPSPSPPPRPPPSPPPSPTRPPPPSPPRPSPPKPPPRPPPSPPPRPPPSPPPRPPPSPRPPASPPPLPPPPPQRTCTRIHPLWPYCCRTAANPALCCPTPYVYNPSTGACKRCPPGTTYSNSTHTCICCSAGSISDLVTEGTLRIVDGSTPNQGRLEVYHNHVWGTICDDFFDVNAASVACKQLGYASGVPLYLDDVIDGNLNVQIWLDDVRCTGSQSLLQNCIHLAWGSHNCQHSEDVGVLCSRVSGSDGTLRTNNGRLEVYHNDVWGSVCDDLFGPEEALVACRQMGYNSGVANYLDAVIDGPASQQIWLDNVDCISTYEPRLVNCSRNDWGVNDCSHTEDVGVTCQEAQGALRLVQGLTEQEGRLEIFNAGQWGTICDDGFGMEEATVACRQLGYASGVALHLNDVVDAPSYIPIWQDDVVCTGGEATLQDCSDAGWGTHNCQHSEDVGVLCSTPEGALRLADVSNNNGRLEIFHAGIWGTVCDDSFGEIEAQVACRQLGYAYGVKQRTAYVEGSDLQPIWLDNVFCTGSESQLQYCSNLGWGQHNCAHNEDVGLTCFGLLDVSLPPEGALRLQDGLTSHDGRLEIYHAGQWGTVCDDNFDHDDVFVACRQLGYESGTVLVGAAVVDGAASLPIWLDEAACIIGCSAAGGCGWSSQLQDCDRSPWGVHDCSHTEDVGVNCTGFRYPESGGLRLRDGLTSYDGRLEIFHDGQWGTVCDDNFDLIDASVACQQLGYASGTVLAAPAVIDGGVSLPIWLDEVACTGSESQLQDCWRNGIGWGEHDCSHIEDVGLNCSFYLRFTFEGVVRLMDGLTDDEGRLEVFHDGRWGTVCDDTFGIEEALVACRQLGYSYGLPLTLGTVVDGSNTMPIWLDETICTGTESNLQSCLNNGWGVHNCLHSEDAGVRCSDPQAPLEFEACVQCPANYWSSRPDGVPPVGEFCDVSTGAGSSLCRPCPAGYVSPPGTQDVSGCHPAP